MERKRYGGLPESQTSDYGSRMTLSYGELDESRNESLMSDYGSMLNSSHGEGDESNDSWTVEENEHMITLSPPSSDVQPENKQEWVNVEDEASVYCTVEEEDVHSLFETENPADYFEGPYNSPDLDRSSWFDEEEKENVRDRKAKCFAPLSFINEFLQAEEDAKEEKKQKEKKEKIESKRKIDFQKDLEMLKAQKLEKERHKCRMKLIVDPLSERLLNKEKIEA